MDLSEHDLSVIYARPDGSYLIDGGFFHVPRDWTELWDPVSAYALDHPEAVLPEPERGMADEETITQGQGGQPTVEQRLHDIEDALVELASIITGGE